MLNDGFKITDLEKSSEITLFLIHIFDIKLNVNIAFHDNNLFII